MKFAAVVVLLALALGAQSSVIPLAYTSVHGPALVLHEPASVAVHAALRHAVAPVTVVAAAAPIVHAAPIIHATPAVVVPAEGTYVAKTRGAVHVAPLPGHANSASSVNLEPAPGTL